jgi:hypothetical protein
VRSSGNITPASIKIARPAHSITVKLSPISPSPPKGTILTDEDVNPWDAIT